MSINFDDEVALCANIINEGKIILYPADTVWGIGCDATNDDAVKKIFRLKQRDDAKSMIILITEQINIADYVTKPEVKLLNYVLQTVQPVTAIYNQAKNVSAFLLSKDGSVGIRIIRDEFCASLINKIKKPLVSTSANISGEPAPAIFKEVKSEIKNGADYIVQHRQGDSKVAKPSAIIKLDHKGDIVFIRH